MTQTTTRKKNINKINSSRNRAILRYINNLHDKITVLYETLMDNDIDGSMVAQKEITEELKNLKIEN